MLKLQRLVIVCLALLALAAAVVVWRHSGPLQEPAVQQEIFGKALRQARNGEAGSARVLYQQLGRDDLLPTQRAVLYGLLADYPSPRALKLARADLHNDDPEVRQAAINAVVGLVPATQRSLILGPLLDDPQASLRYAAATAMLDLSPDDAGLYFGPLDKALDEYRQVLQTQSASGNTPEGADPASDAGPDLARQLLLARILIHQGDRAAASALLKQVLTQQPDNAHAIALQVRLLDQPGNTDAARQWLAEQLRQYPQSAALQHELGLWLVDHKQDEYALLALTRAVELAPDNSTFRYSLALTLHAMEQVDAAQRQLQEIVQRHPQDRRARVLLINYWKETGQLQNVQVLLAQLEQQNPDDPLVQQGL
ncbi:MULTISPECIES: tetratricopeptide repeat protein [Pseudomonas]|uniref:tetratricopeptide repeat protein n=1 Tax=Pseudomonas TaxID=286 RepID=UPI001CF931C7|nr:MULTISPECIES: tetratricopeptide repeat protein [Pseudomonas]